MYTSKIISEKDYKKMVKLIRSGYIDMDGIEHKPNEQVATILVLEANLGCRIGDIVSLTVESFTNDNGVYKIDIHEQKTGKSRVFIVSRPIMDFIHDYMTRHAIHTGRLFSIGSAAVWKQLRAVTAVLGLENVSSHSLRKLCASKLYAATGNDIEAVRAFLNHSDVRITQRYIRRSDAQLEKALKNTASIA